MPFDEEFPEWFRRRRLPFFGSWFFEDVDRMFREMERMMDEEFKAFTSRVPKDYVRERKLPDGSTVREWDLRIRLRIKIGPDGKPEIREFGNVKPTRFGPIVKEECESLADIVETDDEIPPGYMQKLDCKTHKAKLIIQYLLQWGRQWPSI
jgi:HSP20 family protein